MISHRCKQGPHTVRYHTVATLWPHTNVLISTSVNDAWVTCVRVSWSSNYMELHLSYFKADTHYSSWSIISQGIQGCCIWNIVHCISCKKPVLWVSDNTSKLQKTLTDCVRLWCHGVSLLWCHSVRTMWGHCDVLVWALGEFIILMSLWGQCDASIWGHCEVILWPLHDISVRSLWYYGDLKLLTGIAVVQHWVDVTFGGI